MGIRAVVFDAVGTLIHPDPPVSIAYVEVARRFGIRLGDAEIDDRFREAFAQQEACDRRRGQSTSPEREIGRWREIVGDVFCEAVPSAETRERIFAELWCHFAHSKSWRVDQEATSCWQALAARGLIIAIASNFDDRLLEIARRIAPLDKAERVYISARIGYRKPAAEFFRFVERDLALAPGEFLFVGDELENDYYGAKSVGWQAILLNRDVDRISTQDNAVISSLSELADRIDQFDGGSINPA
jgi:putative hydrolase of the HAD superfamily